MEEVITGSDTKILNGIIILHLQAQHLNLKMFIEEDILVTKNQNVDLDEVQRWSIKEGKMGEFMDFKARVSDH